MSKRAAMSPELKKLVKRYKTELKWQDGGDAAQLTYARIKKFATAEQLVKILENTRNK